MSLATTSIVVALGVITASFSSGTCASQGDANQPREERQDTTAADAVGGSEESTLPMYTPPERPEIFPLKYPYEEQLRAVEGWVSLNFMVSPEGKPYEIAVTDSIGGPGFEKAAISALKKATYSPALLDGKPIDAGGRLAFSFSIEGGTPGARPSFVSRWKKAFNLIESGERDLSKQSLDELEPRNLYEDAYYQLGIAMYALKWGDAETVKRAARRALMRARVSDGETYLPEDSLRIVMRTLMVAEWNTRDFVGALETATELRKDEKDPTKAANLDKVITAVENIHKGSGYFDVEGSIADDYSWQMDLLKNRFSINVDSGQLAELKLYCPTRYVGFPFDPSKEYTITTQHGFCRLEVIGDPGSRFTLTQR